MNGIPMQIRRDGTVETVYLSTRRSGEPGRKMAERKKEYHLAQRQCAASLQEVALIARKAEALASTGNPCEQDLDRLALQQGHVSAVAQDCADAALGAAQDLTLMSLKECHGADAEKILDCLTDRQLHQCVGIIETGDLPEDFFPKSAIQPSASSTLPPGGGGGEPSLPTGSPGATLNPGA